MDQALSLKYQRATEQLARKKEELDRVFSEAQRLESDNHRYEAQNRELRLRNEELEAGNDNLRNEVKGLEDQVRKQQQRLQEFIDAEVVNSSAVLRTPGRALGTATPRRSGTPKPQQAAAETIGSPTTLIRAQEAVQEAADMKKKLAAAEETRNKAVEAAEKLQNAASELEADLVAIRTAKDNFEQDAKSRISELEKEVDHKLKSEAALKEVIHQLREHNALVVTETETMEDIEAKAREGLKAEWMALSAQNRKLKVQLSEQEESYASAKAEFIKFKEVAVAKQAFVEDHSKLLADEISALHSENDRTLQDIKRLVSERDGQRKTISALEKQLGDRVVAVAEAAAATPAPGTAKRHSSPSPPRARVVNGTQQPSVASSNVGTPLMEAFKEDPPAVSPIAPAVSETPPASAAALAGVATASISDAEVQLRQRVADLERTIATLNDEIANMRAAAAASSETKSLLQEKNKLLEANIADLQAQVDSQQREMAEQVKATKATSESLIDTIANSPGRGGADAVTLDEVASTVKRLLILATKVLLAERRGASSSSAGADPSSNRSLSTMSTDSQTEEAEAVYPIASCHRFRSPILNQLFGYLGGLEHTLKTLRKTRHDAREATAVYGSAVAKPEATSTKMSFAASSSPAPASAAAGSTARAPERSEPPSTTSLAESTAASSALPIASLTPPTGRVRPMAVSTSVAPGESLLDAVAMVRQGSLIPPSASSTPGRPSAIQVARGAGGGAPRAASPGSWEDRRIALLQDQVEQLVSI